MRRVVVVLAAFVVCIALAVPPAYILTPYGWRHRDCVLQGLRNVVFNGGDELTVDGRLFKVPAFCHTKESWWGPDDYTCTALPCNDWMDNAGYMIPEPLKGPFFRGFSADYVAPVLPIANSQQTLFYFIGLENTNGTARSGPNRVILQPVLTYGNNRPTDSWYIQSWACCPADMTVASPPILGIAAGDTLSTFMNQTSATEAVVFASFSPKGYPNSSLATSLNIFLGQPDFPNPVLFNWADATLEVYNAYSCGAMARGKMVMQNMKLWDDQYRSVPFPGASSWSVTGSRPCGGTTVVQGNSVTIVHNQ